MNSITKMFDSNFLAKTFRKYFLRKLNAKKNASIYPNLVRVH